MIQNDIRENILTTNPISENVKGAQKLDEYIQELLFDDNKLSTLNLKKKNTEKYPRERSINLRTLDETLEYHGSKTESPFS